MMYAGWIIGKKTDREFLEKLGVRIEEEYSDKTMTKGFIGWVCVINHEILKKLDEYWGRFIWSFSKEMNEN